MFVAMQSTLGYERLVAFQVNYFDFANVVLATGFANSAQ